MFFRLFLGGVAVVSGNMRNVFLYYLETRKIPTELKKKVKMQLLQ